MDEIKNKLRDSINEGYINFSKWIIALSTGAIIFSTHLISAQATSVFKFFILLGVVALIISLILGVRSVSLRLTVMGLNYNILDNNLRIEKNNHLMEAGKLKLNIDEFYSLQNGIKKTVEGARRDMGIHSNLAGLFYRLQHVLFYAGLAIISVCGIYKFNN
jgi:hypothetical protein